MAELNTSFWGCAQEDYPNIYGMKRFEKTLKGMMVDNDLPLNATWDETISPWAINPRKHPEASYNCDMIYKCWMFPDMNTIAGLADSDPATPEMILRYNIYSRKMYYPIMFYCGDGGQGNGYPMGYWPGRVGYDQSTSTGDFTSNVSNYKLNLWIPTSYDYSRLCWLIQVYVSTYGHSNTSLTQQYWGYGMWYPLDDITDAMWTDILSGTCDISGVRFVPYYAKGENDPNNRTVLGASGFAAFAEGLPLDGSAEGLGLNAPYTEEYVDYMVSCYSGFGSDADEGTRGGYSTMALGNIGYYDSRMWRLKWRDFDWNWHFYTNLAQWAEYENHFVKTNDYRVFGTNSVFWKNLALNDNDWQNMYYRQYLDPSLLHTKDMMREYIITQCAYLGCWFSPSYSAVTAGAMDSTNPDAYIGIIEEDGTTRGRYQRGSAIDTDQTGWDDPWEYSPWFPPVDPDPTEWDEDQTSIITIGQGDPSYGTTEYLMTQNALDELVRVLQELKTGEIEGDVAEGYCEKAFGSTDPMDAIISVIKYPYDMITDWTDGTTTVVDGTDFSGNYFHIAYAQIAVDISSSGSPPPYTMHITSGHEIYKVNWGNTQWGYGRSSRFYIPYFDKFKNFLDYAPYCTASLYVPFCGSVAIDPEVYAGGNVRVQYYVSPLDGSCKAMVMRDNLVVDTLTGNIGTFLEIHSSDELERANNVNLLNSNIQAQKMNAIKDTASFLLSAGVSAATSNVVSGISAGINYFGQMENTKHQIDQLEYQIATVETPFKQLQAGAGFLSAADEYAIRLVAYRPTALQGYSFDDWGSYGHTTGFACLKNDVLSNYSGYIECTNIVTDGIGCTEIEANMIRSAFNSGVYL